VAEIETVKIQLSALWVAVALTYLLGDVLRIFAGDFKPGVIGDRPMTQEITLGIAALFAIPIVMVVLSLNLDQPVDRWVNIAVACCSSSSTPLVFRRTPAGTTDSSSPSA